MIVSLALALLASATAPEASAPVVAQPAAKPVKEKKICQVDAATTGSLLAHKICKTKSEWEALAAREQGGQADHKAGPTNSAGSSD